MRGKSHLCLGHYLTQHYMDSLPQRYQKAFLVGCIEPDRNPMTYFKGSLRSQWLRGHNYNNARRFMARISRRLERKEKLGLWDYYSMGKLIHYTTDAFTFAHNDIFPTDLNEHRVYEVDLQNHFLSYMEKKMDQAPKACPLSTVMETIQENHRDYIRRPRNIHTDTRFAFSVCCSVLSLILVKHII